ncbi:MAG: hypothetical protein QXF12_04765, partial [Candidatus Aenigmatarchaeota archaeon]
NNALKEEILKALKVDPNISKGDIKEKLENYTISSKDNIFNKSINEEKNKFIEALKDIDDAEIKKIFRTKNAFNVLTNKLIPLEERKRRFDRTNDASNVKRMNNEFEAMLDLIGITDKSKYNLQFKTQSRENLNPLHSIVYQIGYNKLKGNENIKKIHPSRKDEELNFDGISGQNTSASYIIPEIEPETKPEPTPEPRVGTYIPKTYVEEIKEPKNTLEPKKHKDDRFYKQDINNTAYSLAVLNSIKKYLPREFMYSPDVPRPVFVDPERQVQLNSQSFQNTLNVLASSLSPQVLSSISSGIVASSSENIANIIGNTYNQNVNLANQYNERKADILNRQREYNTDKAQNLYDKTVIANQQYDNARREAYRNLVASWNKMLTNRSYRHNMNEAYLKETPFRIDDEGRVQFIPELGKELTPRKPTTYTDVMDVVSNIRRIMGDTEEANKLIGEYLKENLPQLKSTNPNDFKNINQNTPIVGYPSQQSTKELGGEIDRKTNELFNMLMKRLRKEK